MGSLKSLKTRIRIPVGNVEIVTIVNRYVVLVKIREMNRMESVKIVRRYVLSVNFCIREPAGKGKVLFLVIETLERTNDELGRCWGNCSYGCSFSCLGLLLRKAEFLGQ